MTEWQAGDYNAHSRLQQAMAEQHIARLRLDGSERLLDVGCGDGKITARIAERLPRGGAVGVDPSTRMIAFAREHFDSAKWPNLRFELGDARALPFGAEFDRVVSFNALHWVPEAEAALRSIRRALRPGGQALLVFVSKGDGKRMEEVMEEVRRRPRWAGYFDGFRDPFVHLGPDDYRRLAGRAGLEVVSITPEEDHWDFGSREEFLGFVRTTGYEWTNRLPEAERPAYLNECVDRYQELNAPDNVFHFFQMETVLTPARPRRGCRRAPGSAPPALAAAS